MNLEQAQTCKKDYEKENRRNDLYHDDIKSLADEALSVAGNLVDCSFWLGNPADVDTGKEAYDWHEDVVAQIVEDVQNLADASVWHFLLKIEDVVTETDDY